MAIPEFHGSIAGKIAQRVESIAMQNLQPGHIFIHPNAYHQLVLELMGTDNYGSVHNPGKMHIFGCDLLVTHYVEFFEVGVRGKH
jgi:hypothetical protein